MGRSSAASQPVDQDRDDRESEKDSDAEPPVSAGEDDEKFTCVICEERLPLGDFPQRNGKRHGAVCLLDDLAIESMQKQLKQEWGQFYPVKWKAMKRDKQTFNEKVLDFRMKNPSLGRGKRKTRINTQRLTQVKKKTKGKKRRKIRKPMIFSHFVDWYATPAGGSHTKAQAIDKWKEMGKNGTKGDERGVYKGQGGQKRYKVQIGSESFSDSGSADELLHERVGKAAKVLKQDDIDDFLAGDLCLSDHEDTAVTPRKVAARKSLLDRVQEHSRTGSGSPAIASASGATPASGIETPSATRRWTAETPQKQKEKESAPNQQRCQNLPARSLSRRQRRLTPKP